MPDPGKLSGVYNLVVKEEYDLFDHRVPVDEFRRRLREDDIPDELCVVGIEAVFEDEESVRELSRLMNRSADTLENQQPLPTVQFALEESFQRRQGDFEVQSDGELYRLSPLFGPQLERRRSGWLTTPF
jgi:hypothetical protein